MGKRKANYFLHDTDKLVKKLSGNIDQPLAKIELELAHLKSRLKSASCIRDEIAIKKKIKTLTEEKKNQIHEKHYRQAKKRVLQDFKPEGEFEKQTKISLLVNEPVIVNRDLCNCGGKLRVDTKVYMFVCIACGHQSVYVAEDSEKTASNHRRGTANSSDYDSTPFYSTFLKQFGENTAEVPEKVMQLLLSTIDDIHSTVSHTLVDKILTKNKYGTWCKYKYRIAKILNDEDIPVFDNDLISRLKLRFKYIKQAFEHIRDESRKKMPNFVTILKVSLSMEGRNDLVKMFSNHKGRAIYLAEEDRLRKCCELIEKHGGYGFDWTFKNLV